MVSSPKTEDGGLLLLLRSVDWVLSLHCGIWRNEQTDSLAMAGIVVQQPQHPILFQRGGKNTPKHTQKKKTSSKGQSTPPPPSQESRKNSFKSKHILRSLSDKFIAQYVRERRSRQWRFVGVHFRGCDGTTNPPRPERTRLARHGGGEKEKKYEEERTAQ